MSDQESDFSPPSDYNWKELTLGDFATEKDAETALDGYVEASGMFKIYRQITGEILHPRYGAKDKTVRIDRILAPKKPLADIGWTYGCIGIECKKSGKKIGPPLAQALDYSRAAWEITDSGILVICRYNFLWPSPKTYGTTASVQVQHNVGSAYLASPGDYWERLVFQLGNINLFQFFTSQNRVEIKSNMTTGKRTGSR